jgi:hypothetical protein
VRDRVDAIQERIAELSEGAATWPDDIKANAVVIGSAAPLAAICLGAVWTGIAAAVLVLAGAGRTSRCAASANREVFPNQN